MYFLCLYLQGFIAGIIRSFFLDSHRIKATLPDGEKAVFLKCN